MENFKNKILESNIVKHFILASCCLIVLFFVWLKGLDFYTLHNNHIVVPNFYGVNIKDVDSITDANNLRYVVIDSIFDQHRPRGMVIRQSPDSFTYVKKNRRIYLTINSLNLKKIIFPDIYDLSLRQAISKLENLGIEVGDLEYRVDIAKNKVLDFSVNGLAIEKGQELYVGTVVDLVVGKGLSNEMVIIPNLIGLNRNEANNILKNSSLNIGVEIYGTSVYDSSTAIIYKQYPISDQENKLNLGSSVDLYFH